ncbi:EamA family transporter [Rhizobium straminoryzae]|uniref:EamA family transporter n=1 Tax=Rhizobium straminoryzae TaxID=1387186 RepID=A0A549TDV5_9HYPH|nr:EamA family transporter [Rhizobium straminoryzae]TRL40258.1 EamA family transporter [Rhizobium straminoryzae]
MRPLHLAWAVIPALNLLQQVLLKESAEKVTVAGLPEFLLHVLTSPWFLAAIVAEAVCFLIWMTVLSELDLSRAFPLSAASYVLVMLFAWAFFDEPVTPLQLAGSALILGGIACIASAPSSQTSAEAVRTRS